MANKYSGWALVYRVWVEREGKKVLGPGRVDLLEHIDRERSISGAARKMNMSYRRAWELVQDMNEAAGVPLVEANTGGARGGGASITSHGRKAIRLYRKLLARFARAVVILAAEDHGVLGPDEALADGKPGVATRPAGR